MSASARFREALERALDRISKSELHRKTGIARPSIDRYLSGEQVPGLDHAEKIAVACGMRLSDFLGETGDHPLTECIKRVADAAQKAQSAGLLQGGLEEKIAAWSEKSLGKSDESPPKTRKRSRPVE